MNTNMITRIPFPGQPPLVAPGDRVRCRTASGEWIDKVARSKPRFDDENSIYRRCYLTVAVSNPGETDWVNWPAEDVRAAREETEGP